VFPAHDHAALTERLREALRAHPDEIARLGERARERAAGYTYEQTTAGLRSLLATLPRR